MEALPTVLLRPGEADRVIAGHPWIYHASILRIVTPDLRASGPQSQIANPKSQIEDGALVQVKDHRQRLLGVGFYNSRSKIRVRILARDRVPIDADFFRQRIRAAHALRQQQMPQATSYRLVNSESDLLSGLIVDKYEDILVIQLSALGMDRRKTQIIEILNELFGTGPHTIGRHASVRAILERTDIASRKFEGLGSADFQSAVSQASSLPTSHQDAQSSATVLTGELSGPVPVRLNGLTFQTDLTAGHKTGMYLDQQQNYKLVADLLAKTVASSSGPPHVLDCFTFNGAFALHCAAALARAGGASSASPIGRHASGHVHAIDQSQPAIAQAQHNAALNGLSDSCTFETANVFDWLKTKTTTPPHEKLIPRYDLIILDPPSFTRNRASIPDALRGYKEIHLRALKLLRPGGTLATFCCSHHVDAQLFQQVILDAAYDAHRLLRRTATYTQSPDHPVIPAIPETEYLKGYAFQLIDNF